MIDSLKEAGIKRPVHTSRKRLKLDMESHVGAVLFEDEQLEKDGSKRVYIDKETKRKRRKKYGRTLAFSVVIGDRDIDKVEEIYEKFLEKLPAGLWINGDYVSIEPEGADWLDDEDSIIKAKCAAQVKVNFRGGVYQDTEYLQADKVEIEVKKEG